MEDGDRPADTYRQRAPLRPAQRPVSIDALRDDPVIVVPQDVLQRHGARVLDPATAARLPGQSPQSIRSTVYLADKLLVSGTVADSTRDGLVKVANDLGFDLAPAARREQVRAARVDLAASTGHEARPVPFTTLYELSSRPGEAKSPDAWDILQSFRARFPDDDAVAERQIGLDHLLTATKRIHGSPFDVPTAAYGRPGTGGRLPVEWSGPVPAQSADFRGRRPVVAFLDTGCGVHDWFPPGIVRRNVSVGSVPLGLQDPGADPESGVDLIDPLEGQLDPDAGHGTFIAGLVRQTCREATLLPVRVMASDGAVPEHVLLDSLGLLAVRQQTALAAKDAESLIDVVSLSLGYYHEDPSDMAVDHLLMTPIRALAELGVAVVVSAGNDATSRPMYPAAFTPHAGGPIPHTESGVVPVVSVGAQNPDGSIALFSNAGRWVTAHRAGANLVSTFPTVFDGGGQPEYRVDSPEGWRATIDPDNFSSGFGVWSGTSFSAPILAGEIANALAGGTCGSLDTFEVDDCVARGWAAVAACTELTRP